MSIACIGDVSDSIESLYSRYLSQIALGNKQNELILSDELMRSSFLVDLIKVCDLDADTDAVAEYCEELKTLLNYTE